MKIKPNNCWTNFAKALLYIGTGILIISLIIFVIQYFSLGSMFDSKVASELGGYIGGFVGVFWTGAGAILVYATFQEQKKLLEKQQFESSFFKMLDTYNSLLNSMKADKTRNKGNEEIKNGKEYISWVWSEFRNGVEDVSFWIMLFESNSPIKEIVKLTKDFEEFNKLGIPTDIEDYMKCQRRLDFEILKKTDKSDEFYFAQFDYFFNKYKSTMEPYCRFISNIMKYVEGENCDEQSSYKYLRILWSQMTEEELVILFYYSKNKELNGEPKFLNWLKKYKFLDELSESAFLRYDHKKRFC